MSTQSSNIKTRSKAVADRIAVIKGVRIGQEVKDSIEEVKKISNKAADDIASVVERMPYDEERLKESINYIQQAKDVACTSMLIPCCPPAETKNDSSSDSKPKLTYEEHIKMMGHCG